MEDIRAAAIPFHGSRNQDHSAMAMIPAILCEKVETSTAKGNRMEHEGGLVLTLKMASRTLS